MSKLTRGTRVRFTARVVTGTGTIKSRTEGKRGAWYVVKRDDNGETISLRAAQMETL